MVAMDMALYQADIDVVRMAEATSCRGRWDDHLAEGHARCRQEDAFAAIRPYMALSDGIGPSERSSRPRDCE
jgi:hypothetical protein